VLQHINRELQVFLRNIESTELEGEQSTCLLDFLSFENYSSMKQTEQCHVLVPRQLYKHISLEIKADRHFEFLFCGKC